MKLTTPPELKLETFAPTRIDGTTIKKSVYYGCQIHLVFSLNGEDLAFLHDRLMKAVEVFENG